MQSPTWMQGESMDHHGAIHAHRNVEKKGRVRVRSCHLNNSAGPSGIFLGRSWFVCTDRRLLAAIDITPAPSHSPIEPSLNPGRLPPPPFTRTRTTTKAHTPCPMLFFRGSALFEAGWLCTCLWAPWLKRASKAVFCARFLWGHLAASLKHKKPQQLWLPFFWLSALCSGEFYVVSGPCPTRP